MSIAFAWMDQTILSTDTIPDNQFGFVVLKVMLFPMGVHILQFPF